MRRRLIVLTAFLTACDAHTGARIVIRDSNRAVLEGASVRLVPRDGGNVGQGFMSRDGTYIVGRTHGRGEGAFHLEVSKPGYKSYAIEMIAGVRYECEITLSDGASHGTCAPPTISPSEAPSSGVRQ